MTLAAKLQRWRKVQRYTQKAAAEKLGVPLSTYRKYEQGKSAPVALGLRALEDLMKC